MSSETSMSLIFRLMRAPQNNDAGLFEKGLQALKNSSSDPYVWVCLLGQACLFGRLNMAQTILQVAQGKGEAFYTQIIASPSPFTHALRGGHDDVIRYIWSLPQVQENARREVFQLMSECIQTGRLNSAMFVWDNLLEQSFENIVDQEPPKALNTHVKNWIEDAWHEGTPGLVSFFMSKLPLSMISSLRLDPLYFEEVFAEQSEAWQSKVCEVYEQDIQRCPSDFPNMYAYGTKKMLQEAIQVSSMPSSSVVRKI